MASMASSSLTVAFFFISCFYEYVRAASSDSQHLKLLQTKSKSSSTRLAKLSISEFRSVIESAPRSYSLFVLFSAEPSVCQPCSHMRKEFEEVSKGYSSLSSRESAKSPVFFVEVKLSSSDSDFLTAYDIRHVPILYYFSSGKSSYPKPLADGSPNSFNLAQNGYDANTLKQFVNQRTGAKMHVVRGGYEIPFVQTVRNGLPYISTALGFGAALAVYTGAYKSPMLWFGVVVIVYIFSVGGGHYSWIHNTPLAVVDKNGHFQYIAGGSRSQYVAEGFFVSFTCVCISGLVILIQELPSVLSQKSAQTAVGMAMVLMTICAIFALLLVYQFVSVHIPFVFLFCEPATGRIPTLSVEQGQI